MVSRREKKNGVIVLMFPGYSLVVTGMEISASMTDFQQGEDPTNQPALNQAVDSKE